MDQAEASWSTCWELFETVVDKEDKKTEWVHCRKCDDFVKWSGTIIFFSNRDRGRAVRVQWAPRGRGRGRDAIRVGDQEWGMQRAWRVARGCGWALAWT